MSLTTCSDAVLRAQDLAEESKQALQTAEISVSAADDEIYILNTKLRAWYRHPVVWTGVGMVLGGITVAYISRRN
jgi:predicted Zn-dependent protease